MPAKTFALLIASVILLAGVSVALAYVLGLSFAACGLVAVVLALAVRWPKWR